MLVVIAVASGLLHGVQLACLWGLRRSRDGGPGLLLVAVALLPIAYYWGGEAFGWPTPGSIAETWGLLAGPGDRAVLAVTAVLTAILVVAVLVRSGLTTRLERWAAAPE